MKYKAHEYQEYATKFIEDNEESAVFLECGLGKSVITLTAIKNLTVGTITSTLIDSNLIFKWAYKLSSNKFIIVHNHPTGDSTPSIADIKITIDLVKKTKVISFEVIDHIIIGDDCFSMKRDLKDMKVF